MAFLCQWKCYGGLHSLWGFACGLAKLPMTEESHKDMWRHRAALTRSGRRPPRPSKWRLAQSCVGWTAGLLLPCCRVQQAASLWAVAEDNERESMSSTGSKEDRPKTRLPPRSAASQAAAAARAIAAGQALPDGDENDDDDDDSMDDHEPAPSLASTPAVSLARQQGSPPKKVSLIKKWLLFKK